MGMRHNKIKCWNSCIVAWRLSHPISISIWTSELLSRREEKNECYHFIRLFFMVKILGRFRFFLKLLLVFYFIVVEVPLWGKGNLAILSMEAKWRLGCNKLLSRKQRTAVCTKPPGKREMITKPAEEAYGKDFFWQGT